MHLLRLLGSLMVALTLLSLPATAHAYGGNDTDALVITDSNPEPGEPFTVIVDGGPETTEVTLTVASEDPSVPDSAIEIAGSQSLTKAANGAGVAEFTVTLFEEGTYTLTAVDQNGELIGQGTVVVGDGEAADGEGDAGGLPATGSDSGLVALGAAGAVLTLGGAALLLARRRRAQLV